MTSTPTQHARVHGYLFIAMDDDDCGNPEFCHDRDAVLEAVKRSCFSNPESLDADHLRQCEGITDSLIEDGFHNFEGDPPLHLYKLHAPAQPSGLRFPTSLRKMWSGTEVQAWLDQQGEVIRLSDIPEGCTPTDARVLREANQQLAQQVEQLHLTLQSIANAAMDITVERRVLRDAALAGISAVLRKAEGWLAMWGPVSAPPAERKPIGFISPETLKQLRDPEWQAQRGTSAHLWTIDGPPSRATIPVYLGGPDALPERDATKPAEKQGLFRKFDVRRTDGSDGPGGKHEGCEYFVLDVKHDVHAKAALAAYADACQETHAELAIDMRSRYDLPTAKEASNG